MFYSQQALSLGDILSLQVKDAFYGKKSLTWGVLWEYSVKKWLIVEKSGG